MKHSNYENLSVGYVKRGKLRTFEIHGDSDDVDSLTCISSNSSNTE